MRNYDLILKNISKHIQLEASEVTYFTSLLEHKTIPTKSYIQKENQPCNYLTFVNSGILRAYFLNKEGKESTIMFALKDWWVTDMHCFEHKLPAMLNIVAIEKSELLQISKTNLDTLLKEVPKFERFFRIIFQKAYIREQLRVIENLSLTAAERYENFANKYPQIIQQVTQKQIATYLGITPEFLSVIRNKRANR